MLIAHKLKIFQSKNISSLQILLHVGDRSQEIIYLQYRKFSDHKNQYITAILFRYVSPQVKYLPIKKIFPLIFHSYATCKQPVLSFCHCGYFIIKVTKIFLTTYWQNVQFNSILGSKMEAWRHWYQTFMLHWNISTKIFTGMTCNSIFHKSPKMKFILQSQGCISVSLAYTSRPKWEMPKVPILYSSKHLPAVGTLYSIANWWPTIFHSFLKSSPWVVASNKSFMTVCSRGRLFNFSNPMTLEVHFIPPLGLWKITCGLILLNLGLVVHYISKEL